MLLFGIEADDELVPFHKLAGGVDLCERQLEVLLRVNIEDSTGENPLANPPTPRQPRRKR